MYLLKESNKSLDIWVSAINSCNHNNVILSIQVNTTMATVILPKFNLVRHKIGPLASPDRISCLKQLPKTRSGKTMRRILRKASMNDFNLGDISTIADQSALYELFPAGYNGNCVRRIEIES